MLTSFMLKIIAICAMAIDHIGDGFIGHFSFCNLIGRIAFPIFAFFIAEGYIHTSSKKRYAIRLLLFGILSQIPFSLFCSTFTNEFTLNIFFTLLAGLLAVWFYDTAKKKIMGFSGVLVLCLLAEFLHFDYGFYGVWIIFLFFLCRDFEALRILLFSVSTFLFYLPTIIRSDFYYITYLLPICTIAPLFLMHFYQGKQGKKLGLFFYVFYPAHLLLIWLIQTYFLR